MQSGAGRKKMFRIGAPVDLSLPLGLEVAAAGNCGAPRRFFFFFCVYENLEILRDRSSSEASVILEMRSPF
jgi:hypothetical protein